MEERKASIISFKKDSDTAWFDVGNVSSMSSEGEVVRVVSSDKQHGAAVSPSSLDRDLTGLLDVERLRSGDVLAAPITGGVDISWIFACAKAPLFSEVCLFDDA